MIIRRLYQYCLHGYAGWAMAAHVGLGSTDWPTKIYPAKKQNYATALQRAELATVAST